MHNEEDSEERVLEVRSAESQGGSRSTSKHSIGPVLPEPTVDGAQSVVLADWLGSGLPLPGGATARAEPVVRQYQRSLGERLHQPVTDPDQGLGTGGGRALSAEPSRRGHVSVAAKAPFGGVNGRRKA